jgi:hypothetical protein
MIVLIEGIDNKKARAKKPGLWVVDAFRAS